MKHIKEERIVDYALNKLSHDQAQEIENHLFSCEKCQQSLEHWKQLLLPDQIESPSPDLKTRLNHSISKLQSKKRVRFPRKISFVMVSLAVLFLLVVSLPKIQQGNEASVKKSNNYITVQHDPTSEEKFMQKPDTNRLDIIPATINKNVQSDVWLNEVTNEMVLLVDGLDPLSSQDYQLWFIHQNDDWYGELLQIRDGSASIYYKGPDIHQLKHIKVSIEPLGGSSTPTGPETFYLDLNY
ncbi:anti-sigma factor domain-containing protein [Ornithinibacillus salinisoli]|uniref:Anti-sigma-W factor RsiW n=1 Tax=Ornithinibacillus salinisoli TaxID=1848459 RepID=A0ABW4VU65_9BACI